MFETLQIISLSVSLIINVFTLTALLNSKIREKIFKSKEQRIKETEEKENNIETQKCLLRNAILRNYNLHKFDKEWSVEDYENFAHLYHQYDKLKGNSFVKKLWNEVQDWHVIT